MKQIHENSTESYHENEASGKGETFRQRIVALLTAAKVPMTDRNIMLVLRETDVNNIRPEITRLKQAGVLKESGKVKCSVTNKTVRTVCIAKKFDERLF